MASIRIRRNQKMEALRDLTEAVKHNYGSWQTWSNYVAVAMVRLVRGFVGTGYSCEAHVFAQMCF